MFRSCFFKSVTIAILVGGLNVAVMAQGAKWWESVAAIKLVSLKEPNASWGQRLTLQDSALLAVELQEIRKEGYGAIEVIAPAHGGIAWGGLDSENFFDLDPELGNMDDFRRLVRQAHSADLKIMAFINIGYMGKDHPDWIQAQEEALTDINGEKASWFLWSDSNDVQPPINPLGEQKINWAYSEIAQKYYASVWQAAISWDPYEEYPTAQMNWNSTWPQEAEKIVKHWMDTGLDGLSLDAPLEYYHTAGEEAFWSSQKNFTEQIRNYHNGDVFVVAEAVYGQDWLSLAGYDALWDYALEYARLGTGEGNPVKFAIENEKSKYIAKALDYREEMVTAGGTLLSQFPNYYGGISSKRHLYMASLIAIGEALFSNPEGIGTDEEISRLLRMKSSFPALWNQSTRVELATNNDEKYYAVLHTSKNENEQMISLFNFQNKEERITIQLEDEQIRNLKDIRTGEVYEYKADFQITVPARGYHFFLLTSEEPTVILGIQNTLAQPFSLAQNYPNPASTKTTIKYQVGDKAVCRIYIIDSSGNRKELVHNRLHSPGLYEIDWTIDNIPEGLYMYTLEWGYGTISKKLLVLGDN